jgi:hypothetical protein
LEGDVQDSDARKAVLDTVILILTMTRTVFIAELRAQPMSVRVDALEDLERAEANVIERWLSQLERRAQQPDENESSPVNDRPERCSLCKREVVLDADGAFVRHFHECKGSGTPARPG